MRNRRAALSVCCIVMAGLSLGCSNGTYPVHGSIVFDDGSPATELNGGAVEFDSLVEEMSARGSIDENGKFSLSTYEAEDGAIPGKHRVLIIPRQSTGDERLPTVMDPKYQRYETSGIEYEVVPGKNTPTFTIERRKSGK